MKTYQCQSCGNDFESKKGCKSRTPKYCSSKCFGKTLELIVECKLCGVRIENKHSAKISNRIYCSKECQGKASRGRLLSNEWRKALSDGRKASEKCKGPNLYNWKGGAENTKRLVKERYMRAKYGVTLKLPKEHLSRVLDAQRGKCFYCEADLSSYKAIEHLTPLVRGGDNEPYNLVYSCQPCNSKKRTLTLEEFAIKHKRYDWLSKFDEVYANTLC